MSDCKKPCGCWTPYEGVCARRHQCACHITQEKKDATLLALREQQARLRAEAVKAGTTPSGGTAPTWTH